MQLKLLIINQLKKDNGNNAKKWFAMMTNGLVKKLQKNFSPLGRVICISATVVTRTITCRTTKYHMFDTRFDKMSRNFFGHRQDHR